MIQRAVIPYEKYVLYGAKTLILLTQYTHFDFDISRFCPLTIK